MQQTRRSLVLLGLAFAGIVVLALEAGGVGNLLRSVTVAGGLGLGVVVVFAASVGVRLLLTGRRVRRAADAPAFTPTGWEGEHETMRPAVAELGAVGYQPVAVGRSALGTPIVLLSHADGTTAALEVARRRKPPVTLLSTLLVPGEHWAVTHLGPVPQVVPHLVVDAVHGWPAPLEVVDRHRELGASLEAAGIVAVPVPPEGVVDDLVRRVQAVRDDPGATSFAVHKVDPDRRVTDLSGWPERRALLVSEQARRGWSGLTV